MAHASVVNRRFVYPPAQDDELAARVLAYCRAELGTTKRQRIEWSDTHQDKHGFVREGWPGVIWVRRGEVGLELVETIAHECWHSHWVMLGLDGDEPGAVRFGRKVRAEWHAGGLK